MKDKGFSPLTAVASGTLGAPGMPNGAAQSALTSTRGVVLAGNGIDDGGQRLMRWMELVVFLIVGAVGDVDVLFGTARFGFQCRGVVRLVGWI
jgi:hypothetical protein